MAKKNNTKPAKKRTKTVAKAPEVPTNDGVQVVEEVKENPQTKTIVQQFKSGAAYDGLDANHRVDLNGQIIEMFVKDTNAVNKYGTDVVDTMSQIAAIGVISAVADEVTRGNSTFALTVKREMYTSLQNAAKIIGVSLPDQKKLLPGKVADTVEVPATSITVSKETENALKEEHKIEDAAANGEICLNPKEIVSEEDLVKTLKYLVITGPKQDKSLKDSFVGAVNFMRDYRMAQAEKAENKDEAIARLNDRTMYDWQKDIYNYVKPTTYLKGIGLGMFAKIFQDKNPITAFLILRKQLTDNISKKVEWSDQEIADTVRALVEIICEDKIAAETAAIEQLDKKNANYAQVKQKHDLEIAHAKDVLNYLTDVSFEMVEKYGTPEGNDDDNLNKCFGRIRETYYPEWAASEHPFTIGVKENLQQRAGIILNLFRNPDDRNQLYSDSNLVEIKEVTAEEWEKAYEADKQKATAAKKAESKKDLPRIVEDV